MNVSSHYWSPFHGNDCVFSRNEKQKVYYININEIPGELWRETCENNMLSSYVKISPLLWLINLNERDKL